MMKNNMRFQFWIFLLVISTTTSVLADSYRITSFGDRAGDAVWEYKQLLELNYPQIKIDALPEIAKATEYAQLLDDEIIDIVVVPFAAVPTLANSPLLEPFLATSAIEVRQAIDSVVGALAKVSLEQDEYRVLDFWHVASSILASSDSIDSIADLKGRKIRSSPADNGDTLIALGASPVPMPFAEIFSALQLGVVDTATVPYEKINNGFALYEITSSYVDRLYKPSLHAVLIRKKKWDSLPFLDQQGLATAAVSIGEALGRSLDAKAQAFKQDEQAGGSRFVAWSAQDYSELVSTTVSVRGNTVAEKELIRLAYDNAAAKPGQVPAAAGVELKETSVDVLFITDRTAVPGGVGGLAFSSRRHLNSLTFGNARVKLANGRQLGDDLLDVAQIEELAEIDSDRFENEVLVDIAESNKPIVLFVHGYNNAFADAIRRGATIQTDIAPESVVISYTWPSDGALLSYGYDESSTEIADQNFKFLLKTLTEKVSPDRISIVAHSMGSRLLLKYLVSLQEREVEPDEFRLNNVVFAASDMATDLFKQKIEIDPKRKLKFSVTEYAKTMTVYASEYDRPLSLSKKIHGDNRLGLISAESPFLAKGVTSVDSSKIDPARWYQRFSFATRHSYVFDKSAGVQELRLLLTGTAPENRPGMERKIANGFEFWVLNP